MELETLLLIALMLVVGSGTIALLVHAIRRPKRLEQAWRRFASGVETLKVDSDKHGWPRISGHYRDRKVNARMLSRGTGEGRSHHTLVSAPCRRKLPNNFALHPQGMFFALQKAYGAQDIELGDPTFDREFVIEGADEAAVSALLADATLRQTLLQQAKREPALTVSGGQVLVENNGLVDDPEQLQSMFEAITRSAEALEAATTTQAMQHQAHASAGSQHWILERDANGVFAAVMTIPLGLALAIVSAGMLLPRGYGWAGWLGAALLVALAMKLLLPPQPRLRLDAGALTLERGKERMVIPLRQCHWWCAPWLQSRIVCGSLLYLQVGDQQLVIGGAQHSFDDPSWYQAAAAGHPDVVMLKRPFADLLNGLGYAMRQLQRG